MTSQNSPRLLEEYKASLRHPGGETAEGVFQCFFTSEAPNGNQCNLVLAFEDEQISFVSSDFFRALAHLRMQLEQRGITPLINGANRKCYPSGMSRSMGLGLSIYELHIGKPSNRLIKTFEADAIEETATVAEQRAYFERWIESIKNRSES